MMGEVEGKYNLIFDDWEPTCILRRFDDTDKLTNSRLQQQWKRNVYHMVHDGMFSLTDTQFEWRDVPLEWDQGAEGRRRNANDLAR